MKQTHTRAQTHAPRAYLCVHLLLRHDSFSLIDIDFPPLFVIIDANGLRVQTLTHTHTHTHMRANKHSLAPKHTRWSRDENGALLQCG